MDQSGYRDLFADSVLNADSLIIGTLTLPNLDINSVPYIDSSNNLTDVVLGNGQLLIGRTANPPVAGNISGTTDEVIVVNGPGSITLSLPQQIATTSNPTFNENSILIVKSLTISSLVQ